MRQREENLEEQLKAVVKAFDIQLGTQLGLIERQEDVKRYQALLAAGELKKHQEITVRNELKVAEQMVELYGKESDIGANFISQYSILLAALNNSAPQEKQKVNELRSQLIEQLSEKFKAREKRINNLSEASQAYLHQQFNENLQPLYQKQLENRVQESIEALKRFEAQIDTLSSVALSSEDLAGFNAIAQATYASDNVDELSKLEISELINIIQAKLNIVDQKLPMTSQDLSSTLTELEAQQKQLVETDRINQSVVEAVEASGSVSKENHDLLKKLETIGNAMKEFFTETIPNLIDLIRLNAEAKKSKRFSAQHETGKAWVAEGEPKAKEESTASQKTVDPGVSASKNSSLK